MSEFRFVNHPEISAIAIPNDTTQFDASIADGWASVWYMTPEGEGNFSFSLADPEWGWSGQFQTTTDVMENGRPDGTVTADGAYYLADPSEGDPTAVNPADIRLPDFTAFSATLMSLNSADHLIVA